MICVNRAQCQKGLPCRGPSPSPPCLAVHRVHRERLGPRYVIDDRMIQLPSGLRVQDVDLRLAAVTLASDEPHGPRY